MLRRKNIGFYQYGDRSASHSDRYAVLVLDCVYRHRADCAGLVHNYQVLNGGVGDENLLRKTAETHEKFYQTVCQMTK